MPGKRILGFISAIVLLAGSVAKMQSPPHADLTGAWKLNSELTQQPNRERDAGTPTQGHRGGGRAPGGGGMGGMGGGRGPGGMGGGGYGGGGGGGTHSGDPEAMARTREAMRLAMLMPDRLTIVHEDNTFVLTDGEGVTQKLTPDGKGVKSEVGALKVETKSKWDEAVLVVERKFDGGVKITERYWVTENPKQLVVGSKIENSQMGGNRDRAFQRVYDVLAQ
jgi:hypothetical protein